MSRAFVKENDLEHAGADLPERPLSSHPNYVTPLGLQQLQQQAAQLEQERQQLMPGKEDPVTRLRLNMLERDLRYVSARLQDAILIDPAQHPADTILFGARVEVKDENGERQTFTIVGEDEADIASNKISWVSPLARALIGHKIDENVIWQRPVGDLMLEITCIHY
jgi:transcription elongation GreA/GreB family factor